MKVILGGVRVIINIGDDILRLSSLGLLNNLLADKTTKKNLMWATDAYRELGEDYERDQEMRGDLISGQKAGIVYPYLQAYIISFRDKLYVSRM